MTEHKQDKSIKELTENLLQEYQRQQLVTATGSGSIITDVEQLMTEPGHDGLDEDTVKRLEDFQQKEQRERYIDIMNVHAAAVNASQVDRTYRSHDDTMGVDKSCQEVDLMDEYGLRQQPRQNNGYNDDDYFSLNKGDNERAISEDVYYQTTVRRNTFLKLFLDENHIDAFMATHMYGAMNNLAEEVSPEELEDALNTSATQLISQSFTRKVRRLRKQTEKVKKLSPFETYIALVKGYSVLSLLLIPKAFINGGWGISTIFLMTSGCLSLLASLKLAAVGLSLDLYSYPLSIERVLGKKSRIILEAMIALTQFSFAISHITFLIESCKSTVDSLWSMDSPVPIYMIIVIVIYSLLSWVRNLANFSFTFMIGNILIIITAIYVTVVASKLIMVQGGPGPDMAFLEPSGALNTLGFTIYAYEGIGIVMPVMATCEKPERFKAMLTYAFVTLMAMYAGFALICYFAWGSNMDQAIITQMLPADSVTVVIIKFLYSMNLVCSFPIIICPANAAIEEWFCKCLKNDQRKLYWMQNFSRVCVCAVATICAIMLANKLDKFLGLMGSLLCAPLALSFPAIVHYKHLAKTWQDKAVDVALLVISIGIFFFCSLTSILSWTDDAASAN